jgi:hypothetical protein
VGSEMCIRDSLKDAEKKAIVKKYGSLTKAVREVIIPKI